MCKKSIEEIDFLLSDAINVIKQDYDNLIKIAAHSYMLSHILPPYFKKMIKKNPKVKFELHNSNYTEAMDMLESSAVDFALYPVSKENLPKNINMKEFYKCELGIAVPKEHSLATIPDNEITWNMIAKYDFITVGKNITVQGAVTALEAHDIKSRFTLYNGTWEIGLGIINEGLSCSGTDMKYLEPLTKYANVIIKKCSFLAPDYAFHILKNKKTVISKSASNLIEILHGSNSIRMISS